MSEKKFHVRGFIALLTALSAIFMAFSGIILYIVPQGRIAYWTNWELLSLTKENWIDLHVLTSLLFLLGAAYHIYLNWAVLSAYVVKKATRTLSLKKELAVAGVLTLIFIAASVYRVPPLSYVLTLSDYLKDAWITNKELEPPFGRAELLSLRTFANKMNIDLQAALEELQKSNIKIENADEPIQLIAKKNRTSPLEIYTKIKKFEKKNGQDVHTTYTPELVAEKFTGSGIGKKTLLQISKENDIELEKAKQRLARHKIKMAESETLRQAAEQNNTTPIELLKIILIDQEKE